MKKINKLERVTYTEYIKTGEQMVQEQGLTEEIFAEQEMSRLPNIEEIIDKINEIIEVLNEKRTKRN